MNTSFSTVLVVDDRPANRYAIVHTLSRAGFTVTEASSGKEALELAAQMPAVILLDVKLPDILGYEVCRRIKANPQTSHIPVLQLSAAFLDSESRVYALESGADAYLTQPVEPSVLIATVKAMIRFHRAESQTRSSARQWQATFDALSEGVALVDAEGVVQRCNRAMTSLLNRPFAEIEGHLLSLVLRECFGLVLPPGNKMQAQEMQCGERHFRISLGPVLLDHEGNGSIVIVSEITEQKRAERTIVASERLAATGRMANTIAHEINNPLEAITNLLYLLESSLDQPEIAREYLSSAQDELARVSRISRQILSFHRESSSPVTVDLCELLEDVLALNDRAFIEKNLEVKTEWDRSFSVEGFPAQLRQVFSNLVRNAVEASFQGKPIRIRVSGCKLYRENPRHATRITISDRGTGIDKHNLRRVFDAFFTTKELKGSGIGLWLSSTIIHEHKGRIQVRSNTDPWRSGTCVSVVLPCEWQLLSPP